MAQPQPSKFIIAMIWIGFFAAVSAPFIANLAGNYGGNFDQDQITTFNKLTELNNNVSAIKESSLTYKEKTGVLDLVGDIFTQGYQTLKVMAQSLDIFSSMTLHAFENSAYNIPAMENLKTAILLTVIVLIVVGVIMKAVIKIDL